MASRSPSNAHRAIEKPFAEPEQAFFDIKTNSTSGAYDLLLKSEALATMIAKDHPKFDHMIKFNKHYEFTPIEREEWVEYAEGGSDAEKAVDKRTKDNLNAENTRKYTVSADFQDRQRLEYRENYSRVWSYISSKVSYSIQRILNTMKEYTDAKGANEDPLVLWDCIKKVMLGGSTPPAGTSDIATRMNTTLKIHEASNAFRLIRQSKIELNEVFYKRYCAGLAIMESLEALPAVFDDQMKSIDFIYRLDHERYGTLIHTFTENTRNFNERGEVYPKTLEDGSDSK
jgi:hypothetical protein